VIRVGIVHHQADEVELVAILENESRFPAGRAQPRGLLQACEGATGGATTPEGLETHSKLGLGAKAVVAEGLEVELHGIRADAREQAERHLDLQDAAPSGGLLGRQRDQGLDDRGFVHVATAAPGDPEGSWRRRRTGPIVCPEGGPEWISHKISLLVVLLACLLLLFVG
jgi:hypothetical protein